jgi:polyisoprenoid-binding protein YceI
MKPFNIMNNNAPLACLILIVAPLFFGSREPGSNETNSTLAIPVKNEKYLIDTKESVVKWKCLMAVAATGGHKGFVSLSHGELMIEKDQLVGGSAEVDMKTITDESHRSDNNLISHLKDTDFFDVEKFPNSKFAITKVESQNADSIKVTGNLTIKEITHEVTFPVKIEVNNRTVNARGKFTIDRTKWDIIYQSGKFFADLSDRAISDEIEFEMNILAKKL